MNFRQPTIKELEHLPEEERCHAFSSGTEFMMWYANNCDQCKRAWFPKDMEWPSEETTRQYMNCGKYCPIQHYIDLGQLYGYIPEDIAVIAGWKGNTAPQQCRFFSDDDNDRFKYPSKPKPVPKNQLSLTFEQPVLV